MSFVCDVCMEMPVYTHVKVRVKLGVPLYCFPLYVLTVPRPSLSSTTPLQPPPEPESHQMQLDWLLHEPQFCLPVSGPLHWHESMCHYSQHFTWVPEHCTASTLLTEPSP